MSRKLPGRDAKEGMSWEGCLGRGNSTSKGIVRPKGKNKNVK